MNRLGCILPLFSLLHAWAGLGDLAFEHHRSGRWDHVGFAVIFLSFHTIHAYTHLHSASSLLLCANGVFFVVVSNGGRVRCVASRDATP